VRGSRFIDRCFVAVILIALLGFMAGVGLALRESDSRQSRVGVIFWSLK
jgi:hypothetical protein